MESSRMFLVVLYLFAHSHRHKKKYESSKECGVRSCARKFTRSHQNRSDQCVNHFQSISRNSSLLLIILLFRCAMCAQRSQKNNAYSCEIDGKIARTTTSTSTMEINWLFESNHLKNTIISLARQREFISIMHSFFIATK